MVLYKRISINNWIFSKTKSGYWLKYSKEPTVKIQLDKKCLLEGILLVLLPEELPKPILPGWVETDWKSLQVAVSTKYVFMIGKGWIVRKILHYYSAYGTLYLYTKPKAFLYPQDELEMNKKQCLKLKIFLESTS